MPFSALCCDLLTALVDSWSLWERVAGDAALGTRWREASLRMVTGAGAYRPYEPVVAHAAREVGLDPGRAGELLAAWGTLEPYPDVAALRRISLPLVVVTNTSQRLAEQAAANLGLTLTAVVSAESAGWYKPDPRAYRAGWQAAGAAGPAGCLFVAGSAHDVAGAATAGQDVFWVNRRAARRPAGSAPPRWEETTLQGLPDLLSGLRAG